MVYLETNRLLLRNYNEDDLCEFIKMNQDEKVMKFFPNVLNETESIALYNKITSHIIENNFGLFACELKFNNKFIGFIGFNNTNMIEAVNYPFVEIGWRLCSKYHNQGLATEGALACLNYGFSKLGFTEIFSFTSKLNTPSQKVMEKIGMSFIKTFDHPRVSNNSPLKSHVLYSIKN